MTLHRVSYACDIQKNGTCLAEWFGRPRGGKRGPGLQQFLEFSMCETGVMDNTSHGVGVYRIVARNGEDSEPIRHDDMLALAYDTEPSPLQSAYCGQVVYTRDPAHESTS